MNGSLLDAFHELSTPLVADACLSLGIPLSLAPPGLAPVLAGSRLAGGVLPARHAGSVDVFLEAIGRGDRGDVLVVDNGGRTDEGCVGDLVTLEARAFGLAGLLVWGCHRDTAELVEIGLPVFSYGRCPAGPRRLDARPPDALRLARVGGLEVGRDLAVFADADGALFVPRARTEDVLAAAREIHTKERRQADLVRSGRTLHEQLRFAEYLERAGDPAYTFRRHLQAIGGAVEV